MRIKLKTLVIVLICGMILKTGIYGATEVLPKGIWMFDIAQEQYQFDEIAQVEDRSFKFIPPKEFNSSHIGIDGDAQIAEYYKINNTNFNLSYGATDKLTLAINIPYVRKELKYTQEYRDYIETNYSGYIPLAPEKAKGAGIGDIELSFKYKLNNIAALALAYQGGKLKAGNGPLQISDASDPTPSLEHSKVKIEKHPYFSIIKRV
jgi:hypothetical protein